MRIFSRTTNHEDMVIPRKGGEEYKSTHRLQYRW
jgi:hypothetical protein